MKKTTKLCYEAPKAEIIVIETQSVLCASGAGSASNAGAGVGANGMIGDGNTYGW